jgi:hypothetical protein
LWYSFRNSFATNFSRAARLAITLVRLSVPFKKMSKMYAIVNLSGYPATYMKTDTEGDQANEAALGEVQTFGKTRDYEPEIAIITRLNQLIKTSPHCTIELKSRVY